MGEKFQLKVQWNAYSSWMIMDTAIGLYPTPLADAEIQSPNGSKSMGFNVPRDYIFTPTMAAIDKMKESGKIGASC